MFPLLIISLLSLPVCFGFPVFLFLVYSCCVVFLIERRQQLVAANRYLVQNNTHPQVRVLTFRHPRIDPDRPRAR